MAKLAWKDPVEWSLYHGVFVMVLGLHTDRKWEEATKHGDFPNSDKYCIALG